MRKLIYFLNMSLDGYISAPGDSLEPFVPSEEDHQFANDLLEAAGAMIMGRRMYELMSYWDGVDPQDQSQSRVEREFAAIYQALPRYVLSRTLDSLDDPKATLIREDVVSRIQALKAEDGAYLTLDCGPELLAECLQHGLVDELSILIKPLVLGAGKSLFGSVQEPMHLRLTSTQALGSGSVVLTYAAS